MPYTADQHQLIAMLCPAALQSPQAQQSLVVTQRIVTLWEAAAALSSPITTVASSRAWL